MEKYIWGMITWYMFHVIAEKIKPEFFVVARQHMIDFVMQISHNLPCPICAEHAKQHLKRVNFNNIQTKEQFKHFVFAFHNRVNEDLGKPIQSLDVLERYKSADLNTIIRMFVHVHNHESFSNKLMMRKHMKNHGIKHFVNWITTNRFMFD